MSRDSTHQAAAVLLLALALTGCGSMGSWRSRAQPPPPPVPAESHEARVVAEHLATLSALVAAGTVEQAEILARARQNVSIDGSPRSRLMYALMLSVPGHAGSDLAGGRRALQEMLAAPEQLLPQERSLAAILLASLEALSSSEAESRRLRSQNDRRNSERFDALNRRIHALADENEQLRKDLSEANAKLDAIASLERSMSDREPAKDTRKP
jgi:hypothetical protein